MLCHTSSKSDWSRCLKAGVMVFGAQAILFCFVYTGMDGIPSLKNSNNKLAIEINSLQTFTWHSIKTLIFPSLGC